MNKETLKALKGSIEKWKKIVKGKKENEGYIDCPLCTLYRDVHCKDCPVFEKTLEEYCGDTPYIKFSIHEGKNHKLRKKYYAKKELKFLKSLLPKDKINK